MTSSPINSVINSEEDTITIIPLMLREQNPLFMQNLGTILSDLIKEKNLLLTASTDLSHFHHADKAQELDQTIIDHIKTLNPEGLYRSQGAGTGSACGLGAVAALIWAAKASGEVKAHHLQYAHSGEVTGDNASVVGYTAAIITRD